MKLTTTIISTFLLVMIATNLIDTINGQSSSSSTGTTSSTSPPHPSNGQPPVITRVSGCVDVGSMTTECVRPVMLTLYGSGFMTGLEYNKYPDKTC